MTKKFTEEQKKTLKILNLPQSFVFLEAVAEYAGFGVRHMTFDQVFEEVTKAAHKALGERLVKQLEKGYKEKASRRCSEWT